jgi:hypothetical protein
MATYVRAMDDRGVEPALTRLREIFDDETRWTRFDGSSFVGVDAVIAHCQATEFQPGVHVVANQSIVIEGDRATATSDWLWLLPGDPWKIVLCGRYYDGFRRKNGRWLFATRQIEARSNSPLFSASA